MCNKRKGKASHGPPARKSSAKRVARAYEERTGGDTIQRAGGRAVHEDALQERDRCVATFCSLSYEIYDTSTGIHTLGVVLTLICLWLTSSSKRG